MRVLIVEDKVRMASLLQRAVRREGYTTLVAHDGEAALEAAINNHFDALVLDVMLPRLDGFSVLAKLRVLKINVPTILLTARDTNSDIVHGLDLGADDYLTKQTVRPECSSRSSTRFDAPRAGFATAAVTGGQSPLT